MSTIQNTKSWKRWIMLAILCMGAGMIYAIPYIQYSYYKPLQEALGVTNEQLGSLLSTYGIIAMIAYFPGGWLADRISTKVLLAFSFLSTGLTGLYFSTFPSYGIVKLLFILWGITTILTFWAASIKAVRMLGDSSEQGRLFGFYEGGRGLITTIIGFITVAVFTSLGSAAAGLRGVIIVYASMLIITGLLTIFVYKDTNSDEKVSVSFSDLLKVIKMPQVWLIALIIFCAYTVTAVASYLIPYLSDVFKASAGIAATLAIIRTNVMQLVGGPTFGFIADKSGSRPKTIFAGFILMVVFLGTFILLPGKATLIGLAIAIMILLSLVGFGMRGIYYSIVDDAKVPIAVTGAAVGFASLIGYIPDTFIYTLIGKWLDKYPGQLGYNYVFGYALAFAAAGGIITAIFLAINKKRKD